MVLTFYINPYYNSEAVKRLTAKQKRHGILAQLGEHLPYKQRGTGSSPVGPILLKDINQYGEVAQLARASGSYPGG